MAAPSPTISTAHPHRLIQAQASAQLAHAHGQQRLVELL